MLHSEWEGVHQPSSGIGGCPVTVRYMDKHTFYVLIWRILFNGLVRRYAVLRREVRHFTRLCITAVIVIFINVSPEVHEVYATKFRTKDLLVLPRRSHSLFRGQRTDTIMYGVDNK
jgi:hypothetical protein